MTSKNVYSQQLKDETPNLIKQYGVDGVSKIFNTKVEVLNEINNDGQ
ncbi:hypothetical protein JOC36_000062 [Weissella uvarum]|nr:hypothetical protein [Weissella uvarum]MBM7616529.1 hypothetical protein [Weissella uvarum]MCM0595010.1 hypothetical protein [Weissella uvarum]